MIYIIKTSNAISGLDMTNALMMAGIPHEILSKQADDSLAHKGDRARDQYPKSKETNKK